ncbi:MAG: putative Ig domain-containing protein, partial [Leptospiraceae bacterium]|nr:putative Ig domain-containing protein [Leptospiraceae bacterium]
MQFKLLIILSVLFTNCLKAKKSPFDVTSKSSSTASYFAGSGKLASLEANPSSPIVSPTTPTTTSTAVTPPNAPASVSYGASSSFKLIPGNAVNFTPSVSGVVDSWTITPTLPTGLTFDASTGSITGTPSSAIYLNGGFPLTAYTITAQNSGGKIDFNLSLQILGTGENVWTVLNGVSGQDTA